MVSVAVPFAVRGERILDRARDARHRREVVDGLDALACPARRRLVGAVAALQRHPAAERRQVVLLPGREVVEDAHAMALAEERLHEVAADEPRAARHQYVHPVAFERSVRRAGL